MKDDVKVKMPNETFKIIIPSDALVNWDGVLKFGGRLKGDHVTHFWSWIKRPITWSSEYKCSYAYDTIEKGPMMWVSSTMDGNR